MKKRLLSFVLAVLMIASLLPATVLAADIVASGTCGAEGDGSNLTWTLDSDGMLKIEGSGKMEDYMSGEYDTPWCNYNRQIQEVSISAGVTYIGEDAFNDCYRLSVIHVIANIPVMHRAFCSTATKQKFFSVQKHFLESTLWRMVLQVLPKVLLVDAIP